MYTKHATVIFAMWEITAQTAKSPELLPGQFTPQPGPNDGPAVLEPERDTEDTIVTTGVWRYKLWPNEVSSQEIPIVTAIKAVVAAAEKVGTTLLLPTNTIVAAAKQLRYGGNVGSVRRHAQLNQSWQNAFGILQGFRRGRFI